MGRMSQEVRLLLSTMMMAELVRDLSIHNFDCFTCTNFYSPTCSKITEFLCTRISGTTGLSYCEIHACTVLTISKENKNIKEEETDQFAKPLTHGVSDPVYNFDFS